MLKTLPTRAKVFITLCVLVGVSYGNVLKGPLLFDDEFFVEKNQAIRSLKNIPKIYFSSARETSNFYRPHQQLVNAVVYHFFELNPVPYHAVSLILHLLNAYLIFILLMKLSLSERASAIAAVLFLIHPIQTEAVSSIAGMADPLGSFFLLCGIIQFVKSLRAEKPPDQTAHTLYSAFLYVMALLCKENMVIFLPLSIVVAMYVCSTRAKRVTKHLFFSFSIFSLIALAYLFLKFSVFNFMPSIGLTEEKNLYTENWHIRLITFINILWEYARMIFWPADLNYEKPYFAYSQLFSFRAAFGMLFITGFAGSAFFLKRCGKIFLGLGWFFAAIIPYTGIIPLNAMYLEHWLYMPIVGILILFASLCEYFEKRRAGKALIVFLIPVCVLCVGKTVARNTQWADIEKFYLNELRYTSSSIRVYNNLGMYYADKENYDKAVHYYTEAIQTADTYPQPHHNLSGIYLNLGQNEKAIQEIRRALQIDPNFIYSLVRLQKIYLATGQNEKAQNARRLILNVQNGDKNTRQEIEGLFSRSPKLMEQ